MATIRLRGVQGAMSCALVDVPAFPGEGFGLGYPEAIGDVAAPCWFGSIAPTWEERPEGVWMSKGSRAGELSYTMTVTPGEDSVTAHFSLKNEGSRTWSQGMAFNCFQCGGAPSIRDHDCLRHWVRGGGRFLRLVEVPRVFGPRPAVQLYSVEGAPLGRDLPFVGGFQSTPDVVLEPWMAIRSRDGERLVATVSQPGLFLFQNREYSCIHSGTGFGRMEPGETAEALNRVYFVRAELGDWHERMRADFAPAA